MNSLMTTLTLLGFWTLQSAAFPSFVPISDLAQDCMDAMGDIVQKCQNDSMSDWSSSKMHTKDSTTWETCCSVYQELDCYVRNSRKYCPVATRRKMILYKLNMVKYFNSTICTNIAYANWKKVCSKDAHDSEVHKHNSTNAPSIPKATGLAKKCLDTLNTKDLVNKCSNASEARWNPDKKNQWEHPIVDTCCSTFQTIDCLQSEASKWCTKVNESLDMDEYARSAVGVLSVTLCKTVPYNTSMHTLCRTNGAHSIWLSLSVFLSILIARLVLF